MQLTGNELKRLKRQLSRFYLGVEGFQPEDYEFVTLTTPEGFPVGKLNDCFRWFKLRMQRAGMWGAYYAIREWNAKGTTEHIHILLKVRRLDYKITGKHWTACVNRAAGTDIKGVWWKAVRCWGEGGSMRGLASYISKYLSKQSVTDKRSEAYLKRKGRSMWYSQDWIFPKWKAFNKLMWRLGTEVDVYAMKMAFKREGKKAFYFLMRDLVGGRAKDIIKLGWSIALMKELAQFGLKEFFRGVINAKLRVRWKCWGLGVG